MTTRRLLHLFVFMVLAGSARGADDPRVAFLSAEQARAAILDESVEPYFSLLQAQEMGSKTGAAITGATLAEQRDECRRRYQAAVSAFSPAEQQAVTRAVEAVDPQLAKTYPRFAAEPWRFIKLDGRFEGGMPHTRGHCIVLSDRVLPMFAGHAGKAAPGAMALLVHEQTHVVQRLHPAWFARLYTEGWGFARMPREPEPSPGMIRHQLVNPDGIACVWAFPVPGAAAGTTSLIEPQVVLGSDDPAPAMPGDFKVIALTVTKAADAYAFAHRADGEAESVPLESVRAYIEAFAPSEENFHPNEICAELFSTMVILDLLGRTPDDSPCTAKLRAWAAVDLGGKPDGHDAAVAPAAGAGGK